MPRLEAPVKWRDDGQGLAGYFQLSWTPSDRNQLTLWVGGRLTTGLALAVSETGFTALWFHQLRGLMTMSKLLLLAIVPLIFSLGISLFNYSLGSKPIWVGLGMMVPV